MDALARSGMKPYLDLANRTQAAKSWGDCSAVSDTREEKSGDLTTESLGSERIIKVIAYTDGACSGNPGPGGWGVLLQAVRAGFVIKEREFSGGESATTNNRMEMIAAIKALECLSEPCTHPALHRQPIREGRNHCLDPELASERLADREKEACEEFRTLAALGRALQRARRRVELAQRTRWHRRKRKSGRARATRDEALLRSSKKRTQETPQPVAGSRNKTARFDRTTAQVCIRCKP